MEVSKLAGMRSVAAGSGPSRSTFPTVTEATRIPPSCPYGMALERAKRPRYRESLTGGLWCLAELFDNVARLRLIGGDGRRLPDQQLQDVMRQDIGLVRG